MNNGVRYHKHDHRFYFPHSKTDILFQIGNHHVIKLLAPFSMEPGHLQPIYLILDTDTIQLTEYLGGLDIIPVRTMGSGTINRNISHQFAR